MRIERCDEIRQSVDTTCCVVLDVEIDTVEFNSVISSLKEPQLGAELSSLSGGISRKIHSTIAAKGDRLDSNHRT